MALDPRIESVREKYGLAKEDFWQIPQNKQWVCKHAALEVVATKANVEWQSPQIIQADTNGGIAVLVATGKMGTRIEWATGEASPKNNKNSYPWAMAEKRAKDRVVLKLVGIHGLVYSEDEADDFKAPPEPRAELPAPANDKPKSSASLKRGGTFESVREQLAQDMLDVSTFAQFEAVKEHYRAEAKKNGWNNSFLFGLSELFGGYEKDLSAKIEAENTPYLSTLEAGE
ncbi:hypothetical protein [Sinorhizobium meliloti]|uniref:hypothetical protein n=1 Tax=Rhizobium meliloti TaxID=382 RepID=UPI000FDADBE1|nr:hypothetical protein [Sinorhizobium meliloti]RVG88711.1 hypothetical protein CN219_03840 [Sinorhizobium meliloti]RVI39007.1 hypothetical protein CN197_02395 [Sinorhizobium meliloti]RVI46643.1 hypothetical protein CN196_09245 [Sinorhizobium meliloti]RVJ25644.1 hypothetical protein CN177_13285 [Sinorhizobium meliloti]RVK02277.1 hypothetical protein CN170_08845 [Sinorhizobium meliloti]